MESGPGEGREGDESIETRPIGTLFFLTVYIMVLAGMWLTMYWVLISR